MPRAPLAAALAALAALLAPAAAPAEPERLPHIYKAILNDEVSPGGEPRLRSFGLTDVRPGTRDMTDAQPDLARAADSDELFAALAAAEGPTRILLEPGDYSFALNALYGTPWADFDHPVTIASADPSEPARLLSLSLIEVGNIAFEGLLFDLDNDIQGLGASPFQVLGSSDITIRDSVFDGDFAPPDPDNPGAGYPVGGGLKIVGERVTVENNVFQHFHVAMSVQGDGHVIRNNDISGMRVDGIIAWNVRDLLIENNHFHDFIRALNAGDHSDMIQLHSFAAPRASGNITIRGNVLDSGAGHYTQSIFMRNENVDGGGAFEDWAYYDIRIEDNVIRNAHPHGITVGETNGLTIANNTVIHNPSSGGWTPRINVTLPSREVTVVDNITHAVPAAADETWFVDNNLIVQSENPRSATPYLDRVFINPLSGGYSDIDDWQALPGGIVEEMGVGAALTRYDPTPERLTAIARMEPVAGAWGEVRFDASLTADADGAVGAEEAEFVWTFGDGATATGISPTHAYAAGGGYPIRLEVRHESGAIDVATGFVEVPERVLLALRPGDAAPVDTSSFAEVPELSGDNAAVPGREGGLAFRVGEAHRINFDRGQIEHLRFLEGFTLALGVKAATGSAADEGALYYVHGDRGMIVTAEGELHVFMTTEDGGFGVTTQGANLLDGAWHDVAAIYDYAAERLSVVVDGAVLAETQVTGATVGTFRDHEIGHPWGKDFEGYLDRFDVYSGALGLEEIAELRGGLDGAGLPETGGPAPGGTPPLPPPPLPEEGDRPIPAETDRAGLAPGLGRWLDGEEIAPGARGHGLGQAPVAEVAADRLEFAEPAGVAPEREGPEPLDGLAAAPDLAPPPPLPDPGDMPAALAGPDLAWSFADWDCPA